MTAANAFSSQASEGGQAEHREGEPSMEDILASIRRIIADDQLQVSRAQPPATRRAAPPVPPAHQPEPAPRVDRVREEEVMDLADFPDAVQHEPVPVVPLEPRAAGPRQPAPPAAEPLDRAPAAEDEPAPRTTVTALHKPPPSASILRARLPEPQQAPRLEPAPEASRLPPPAPRPPAEPEMAEADLLSPQSGATVSNAFEALAASVALQHSDTIERVLRELLRPLLKTWLDDNLPTIVERLVRAEIERVARGSR